MKGVYEIEGSGFIETGVSPAEMIREYRKRLVQPGWKTKNEGSGDGIAWFSWSVLDDAGHNWSGTLVVATVGEGWQRVWLSLHSAELR